MSDLLEQLNRRLKGKEAEAPAAASAVAGAREGYGWGVPGEGEDIALVFAPGGPVARLLGERYRPRRGQARMARTVLRALQTEQHALVEAGTGSGKSFAYLIPLLWTGQRAIVSTANKTLQNQLWEQDLPALQRIAPQPFTAALLKGRGNYVCPVKMRALSQQLILPGEKSSFKELLARLDEVPSGDVEEMRLFGELREAVTASRHDCLGHQCPLRRECFYELARLRAVEADLVVVNHALLAFNLAVEGQIIELREAIVIDEAQELERYVVHALRHVLEYEQVPGLVNDAVVMQHVQPRFRTAALQANNRLFDHLEGGGEPQGEWRWAISRDELPPAQALADRVQAIHGQLQKSYSPLPGVDERSEENARHLVTLEWAGELIAMLQALGRPVPDDAVRYCEQGRPSAESGDKATQGRVVLCQEPVEVSGFLQRTLWEPAKTVICTTATLTVDRRFDYFRWQSGAPPEETLVRVVESPFDFQKQALIYTPLGLVPQYGEGEEAYVEELTAEVERLIRASRGRAFVLCTSARRARQLYEALEPRLPYDCYRQSMAPRYELLERFRSDADGAVLFATKSFWEGVDVPGEALSLVIIDKLPFAPHMDPVVAHRQERVREAGGNPFLQVLLPEAILALKQGVGRLIRTETDRGVMAILDSRIHTKRYGRQVLDSLPPARRTVNFEDVQAFFGTE